jgi:hypothetical protein
MFKKVTALALTAVAMGACSMNSATPEEVGAMQQEIVSCSVSGLEWKPFLAHLAYDAAEDFGRWEFTTDLQVAPSGDRLQISSAGYSLCASRGRSGCPSMTAGLSAQEGDQDVQVNGKMVISPNQIRSMLMSGFAAQKQNEDYIGYISDSSEPAPYTTMKSPTRTGLPHTVSLTNCAATIYSDYGFSGASQCLRTGSYRMADLKIGNDALSSLKVRSGMKVTLYENDQFGGANNVQTADVSAFGPFNDRTSSIVVSTSAPTCSAVDTYKVTVSSGNWTDIRAKLVTLGYMRGNDVLDVRIDLANGTIDVDPFNVDFVPPSQIGGTVYGIDVKSPTAETWRSTEDPSPSIFPIGGSCKKKPYGSTLWSSGIVKASGSYRYCYL